MILAVDTETTGISTFSGCRPFLITACDGASNYIFRGIVDPYTRNVTWPLEEKIAYQRLQDSADTIIMHNANFDIRMLDAIGIDMSDIRSKLDDTLIASHCICSGDSHGLKDLAIKYLNFFNTDERDLIQAVNKARIKAKKKNWQIAEAGHPHFPALRKQGTSFYKMDYWLAPGPCEKYAVLDVERTLRLWDIFRKNLLQCNLWTVYKKRMELLTEAYNMQSHGKYFYVDQSEELIKKYQSESKNHNQRIRTYAKIDYAFDSDKPAHLIDLLHKRCMIPILYHTDTMKPATDKDAIKGYRKYCSSIILDSERTKKPHGLIHPELIEDVVDVKKKNKKCRDLIATKLWLDKNGRTHSTLNITGTRATRQSSTGPNDQNFDRDMKYLFGPPPGYVWICTDMVAIELRIWAYVCGNTELISFFERGKSVHYVIFEMIMPDVYRRYMQIKDLPEESLSSDDITVVKTYGRIKNGTFSRIYGASDKKTNETYHGSKHNAPDYCSIIDARFPQVGKLTKQIIDRCSTVFKKQGVYSIYTMKCAEHNGYRLDVDPNKAYAATDYHIQGTAGWIMGEAMIDWGKHPNYLKHNCHMISQVHDGLDTEVPICPELPSIIASNIRCIEAAGERFIPTCRVSWKLRYHPQDENNEIIQQILSTK